MTNNSIFIVYQYEDGMMQWSSANSEVSMSICGVDWQYELPSDGSNLHTSIVTNTNVKEPGRYAFLYKDNEINPAGIFKLIN